MKKFAIIAAILVALGAIIWELNDFNLSNYTQNSYTVEKDFNSIEVLAAANSVEFINSNEFKVVCTETNGLTHKVAVENGVLKIETQDSRKWYTHIVDISFTPKKIEVHIPADKYESLTVKAASGSVKVPSEFEFDNAEISAASGSIKLEAKVTNKLNLSTASGSIKIGNSSCQSLLATSTSGSIKLENCFAENLEIKTTSGSIRLDYCDFGGAYIKSTSGSVKGILLSEKSFVASSTSGSIKLPTGNGERCEVKTTSGSIKFEIK